ncbi:MAG: FAD-dependent oxidoreductase [Thermoplasmata archaeon]
MERFDCIVAGAGLSGLSAAYRLAKEGVDVLVLERGSYPGSKSMTGGRLYIEPVKKMMSELWNHAPFERSVSRETITLMDGRGSVSISFEDEGGACESYTVLRGTFDRWLSSRAEEVGATIVPKTRVDSISVGDEGATVNAGGADVECDMVLIAEGSPSVLASKMGLISRREPKHYAVGVKEIIEMDSKSIDGKFGVGEDEGCAAIFVGSVTKGVQGGGFLYTNRESISLGCVANIGAAMRSDIRVHEFMEDFKSSNPVKNLIRGGNSVEYSARMIPEFDVKHIPRLYGDRVLLLGDAACLSMNIGYAVRGMDSAIASGFHAAETAKRAVRSGDFSKDSLSGYDDTLRGSFVLGDMERFSKAQEFLKNERIYEYYPALASRFLKRLFSFTDMPKEGVREISGDEILRGGLMKILIDMWRAWRWL